MEKEATYGSPTHDAKCRDDLKRYIEAILWDLENFGNYMFCTSGQDIVNRNYGSCNRRYKPYGKWYWFKKLYC